MCASGRRERPRALRGCRRTEAVCGQGYDRVLVDPPCSDLGTLASRPDARWRKDPETIDRLGRRAGPDPRERDRRAAARRDARLLDLHDLGARERSGRGRGARRPMQGSPSAPADDPARSGPDRRLLHRRAAEGRCAWLRSDPSLPSAPPALAAASHGFARRTCPAGFAVCPASSATRSPRRARTAASTRRSSGSAVPRTWSASIAATRCSGPYDSPPLESSSASRRIAPSILPPTSRSSARRSPTSWPRERG